MVDSKISELGAIASIAGEDLFALVDDPSGVPVTVKGTITQLAAFLDDLTQTLTNKTISLTSNTISGTTAEFNTALSDGSFATLAGTETLTNKTVTTPTLTLKQGLTPTPTAEGDIQWDTDNNQIKVGDGAGTKTFSDDTQLAAASHTHVEADITDLQAYLLNITGENLSSLADVTITGIGAGEILKWSGSAWINNTLAEAGIAAASHTHTEADISDLGTTVAMVADNLSVFAATTSAQLNGVISDNTGTGALVFGTSPTIVQPSLTLQQSAAPTPTAEGDIQWDTDDSTIKVGDGVATITFSPDSTINITESQISDLGTTVAMVADNLGVFAATTSAQLRGVISDETGTGALVFAQDPILGNPKINDTSANHQYIFGVSELIANRTITLPLLTGNDTFVFEAHTQTLTNKTINTASNTITINEADIADLGSYITASSVDTLTNKTFDANGVGNSISNIDVADHSATGTPDATTFYRGDNTWAVPAGSGDMVLASVQTVTGAKTFADDAFLIQNPAATFEYLFQGGAIAADRTINLPVLTGTDTLAFEAHAATLTNKTLGSGTVISAIPTINDGITFTFNPSATVAGINVGAHTADPSSPVNGDIIYNSTSNKFRAYENGAWSNMIGGGAADDLGNHTATQDLNMAGFNIDSADSLYLDEKAAADVDVTGDGQLWVKNDTPNTLWFTNDAGTDFQVATLTGTETLTNKTINTASNTITVNEADISDLGTTVAMVADNLSVFAATTSAQLAGVISDETGTGLLVFGTNPVITQPTLTLTQSVTPTPTAEGVIEWDTDNNQIKIGDGVGTKTFSDDTQLAAASHTHTESDITDLGTTVAMVADNLSVFAATTSAQLAGVISDETGSGALVFGTSPVLTTPQINDTSSDHQYIFGVSELTLDRTITLPLLTGNDTFVFEAHSQTLTNKTINTASNTITVNEADISDLGTTVAMVADNLGVFAATTSLQLKNVISDETGSGALVFATSPTLVTPILGTPTSGNLSNCTAYPGDASLVTTGTITSGTWNGSVIASAYLDADTAHLSGAQTFTGKKTMTSTGAGDAGINLGSSATAPTTNLANGDIYYNTTDNKLYGRINAAWVDLGQSGAEVTTWTQDHSAGNFNLDDGNSIYLNEKAAANADIAGDGQIWVKTATPNELWFTDDAGTDFQVASKTGTHAATESFVIACSDETTAITTTGEKVEFRMPYAFTVTEVRASLTSACTTGTFTVDIHESGTTIMTTNKITIDATEKTSETAATAPGITDSALADDAEIQIDVDNVGDSTATGLKVYIIGYKT